VTNGLLEIFLEVGNVVLEEPYFSHCFVKCEDKGIALLEDLCICNSLNVVKHVGTSQLQRVNL